MPLALYDRAGAALVMSPYADNYFIATQTTRASLRTTNATPAAGGGGDGAAAAHPALVCGLHGNLKALPAGGFETATVLRASADGVNAAFGAWGGALRARAGVGPKHADDFVVDHLGYWTDRGAFYYHSNGTFATIEDALVAVQDEADAKQIPLQYIQVQ